MFETIRCRNVPVGVKPNELAESASMHYAVWHGLTTTVPEFDIPKCMKEWLDFLNNDEAHGHDHPRIE